MITQTKLRVIKDYDKLSEALQEQIKLVYPEGYAEHLIEFRNAQGEKATALPFETFEKIYLVRMTAAQARKLVSEDDDFDDEGNLWNNVRAQYEEEHDDVDYLSENDNYEETW